MDCKKNTEEFQKKNLLLFPGQGAQFVGMGKEIAAKYSFAKERFNEANDILKVNLFKIIMEGPEDTLTKTEYAQPAIYTLSSILYDLMVSEGYFSSCDLKNTFVAGHSLGEFSAVYAAGGYSFEDGLRLVKSRSELMSEACRMKKGKMLAVVRINVDDVEKFVANFQNELASGESLVIANINSPKQVVVSGDERCIDAFAKYLTAEGVRSVPLKVAGAFHSPLMAPVLFEWKNALANVNFLPLRYPLIPNVVGDVVFESEKLNDLLYRQLVSSVQWVKTMKTAEKLNCQKFYEVGPGNVLGGLLVKFYPGMVVQSALATLNA